MASVADNADSKPHKTRYVDNGWPVIGDPDDFGSVVAFLCGESAKFVTGVQVHVDGGAFGGLQ